MNKYLLRDKPYWLMQRSKSMKNKTYDEIYGIEKAEIIRNKQKGKRGPNVFAEEKKKKLSELMYSNKNPMKNPTIAKKCGESQRGRISLKKGQTYEECYGEKKAKQIKQKSSDSHKGNVSSIKGKTYEQAYGETKAEEIKNKIRGHNNVNWAGGISLEYYGHNWKSQKRKAIKRADGHCEYSRKLLKAKITVHHKKPFKAFAVEYILTHDIRNRTWGDIVEVICEEANDLNNLIVINNEYHNKLEKKSREKYIRPFGIKNLTDFCQKAMNGKIDSYTEHGHHSCITVPASKFFGKAI